MRLLHQPFDSAHLSWPSFAFSLVSLPRHGLPLRHAAFSTSHLGHHCDTSSRAPTSFPGSARPVSDSIRQRPRPFSASIHRSPHSPPKLRKPKLAEHAVSGSESKFRRQGLFQRRWERFWIKTPTASSASTCSWTSQPQFSVTLATTANAEPISIPKSLRSQFPTWIYSPGLCHASTVFFWGTPI